MNALHLKEDLKGGVRAAVAKCLYLLELLTGARSWGRVSVTVEDVLVTRRPLPTFGNVFLLASS